jgi:hypothetical protein
MTTETAPSDELTKLDIKCLDTDCENGLHCFMQNRRKKSVPFPKGHCWCCGKDLVDWERVHQRDFSDALNTFESLKKELVRHHHWHAIIDQRMEIYARRKGLKGLRARAEIIVHKGLKPPYDPTDFFEKLKTPKAGSPKANVIHYAQHFTGCCCRRCIEEWHGIPSNRELTKDEMDYFVQLIMLYIVERFPFITKGGEKLSHIKSTIIHPDPQAAEKSAA